MSQTDLQLHPEIQRMLDDRDLSLQQLKKLRFEKDHYELSSLYLRAADRDADAYTKYPEGCYAFLDGKLVMITHDFWTAKDSLDAYSMRKLLAILGPPDVNLAASAPMGFREYVYLQKGIMILGNEPEDYYDRAVVFPPMTLEQYKSLLWHDPSKDPKGPDN